MWRGDNVVLEAPLHAAADVGIGNLPQRALRRGDRNGDRAVPRRRRAAMMDFAAYLACHAPRKRAIRYPPSVRLDNTGMPIRDGDDWIARLRGQ